jgi:hypothetical protein
MWYTSIFLLYLAILKMEKISEHWPVHNGYIQTVLPSLGERYLSSALFDELRKEAEAMEPVSVD